MNLLYSRQSEQAQKLEIAHHAADSRTRRITNDPNAAKRLTVMMLLAHLDNSVGMSEVGRHESGRVKISN